MLEREFKYYQDHKEALDLEFDGQFIVIVGTNVIGSFPSHTVAITEASKEHAAGTFLVQLCSTTEDQTQVFHSRVAF